MLLVLPASVVEVKEDRHLMRHLELPLFLDCFPKKYTEKEAATAIANKLKRALDRKGGDGRKKGLEVAFADFSPDNIENENGLIGSEEEEDARSNSFDEM